MKRNNLFETIKEKTKKATKLLNVLEILNDMECYERYNWKIKDKIEKSSA